MLRTNKKLKSTPFSEINVVPYIDVMLVLLVIFMITAPMLSQGVTVDLPKASASETLKNEEREPIIVSINREGQYFLNINDNPQAPMEAQALMVRVNAELVLAKESKQNLRVLVKGDEGVFYGKVVEVMGYLKEAGAEQVGLLTDATQSLENQA